MRTIVVEVRVPDDFDAAEQAWEVQQAAQQFVDDNFETSSEL